MAQIKAKWPKFKQNAPNLARKPQFWPEVYQFGPLDLYCDHILAILLGFGPFCLDLGHYAWIWTILLRFGPYCSDLGCLAKQMDGRTDGRTDSPVFYRNLFPLGMMPCSPSTHTHAPLRQGRGTADHLLPLGCYCFCLFIGIVKVSFIFAVKKNGLSFFFLKF